MTRRQLARELRINQSDAESRLWHHLRGRRFQGIKFRRQQPLGPYIVDFISLEHRLMIELDGGQHAEQTNADQQRDAWLRSQGFRVLRFWNSELSLPQKAASNIPRQADSGAPITNRGR